MILSESLAAFNRISIPEPEMPANPVPEPKNPTVSPGKLFKNPRIVDSPNARYTPTKLDATSTI